MRSRRERTILLFVTASLLTAGLSITGIAYGGKGLTLTEEVRSSIEKAFPGAEITGTEKERWRGQEVTEVELVARDGNSYEVYVSADGTIQKIELEDGWFK
ncbi:MAG: PepSY domain-containing protein [Desulfopila sp.]|jgi:hypothetical protein|nr:PepSY domain-containing protein [Desulfopila sp.]